MWRSGWHGQYSMGWTVQGSHLIGGSGIFQTHPHQPQDQSSLLYNGLWVSFPCVKQLESGATVSTPSSSEVKLCVELHLYRPSVSAWHDMRQPYIQQMHCLVQKIN
jgi:hypothetical protein